MNEEKRTVECGEEEKTSGVQEFTSQGTENPGEIKDEKAPEFNSSVTPENELAANNEKTNRYF